MEKIDISKSRLESFSDGVFAIVMTIMVLDLKAPNTGKWSELLNDQFIHHIVSYVLSFLFVASFWISHHTIILPVKVVDKKLLWMNTILLLPMSLLPLVTDWHGEYPKMIAPSVCYISIYVLSVFALYMLGRVALNRIQSVDRKFCHKMNQIRLWIVLFGLWCVLMTFFYPTIASFAVIGILLFWLLSSNWQKNIFAD
ncbi:Potassium channel [Oenococcus sicerae]|nr:Potassium channel [Oenococcus sicerae]